MKLFPDFQQPLSRRAFLSRSLVILVAQYVTHGLVFGTAPKDTLDAPILLFPSAVSDLVLWASHAPLALSLAAELLLLGILDLAVLWSMLALSIRCARTVGRSLLSACWVSVPVAQLFAVCWLATDPLVGPPAASSRISFGTAAKGLLAGCILAVVLEILSTLVFGTYGAFLFFASPFIVGCTTGYIGNRRGDIGSSATIRLVLGACLLGSIGLLAIAVEGVVCLALATPLIALMAICGGAIGRSIAIRGPRATPGRTAMSVMVLPLFLAIDAIAPPHVAFQTTESIEVQAGDWDVWNAVVHMGPIPDAPAVPFRWGLAYPMRGVIHGGGVGAIREGVFSTGVAYERVTRWQPPRELTFEVLSDPPTMHELSPYQDVHAPHVNGYFKTLDARFTITPLSNGHTRLTLDTHHELNLNPYVYWLPIVKWAIHANKTRVLRHFAHQAEAAASARAF